MHPRTQKLVLVTTLLDAAHYRARELGRIHFRRRALELFLRDLKQTLGLDVLRCPTPKMVEKEIVMHALAYSLIRALLQDIAQHHDLAVSRLSFRGTVDALRPWQEIFEGGRNHPRRVQKLRAMFYQTVAGNRCVRTGASRARSNDAPRTSGC